MANILNGFLDNLVSGASNPKGTFGDYKHAARLYVDDAFRLAPKTKYLYHTYFAIDPNVGNTIQALVEKYGIEIGLLVKMADLPKFQATVETRKKYNRTKHMQTAMILQLVYFFVRMK